MAIVVTPAYYSRQKTLDGRDWARASLAVTGLVVGANIIPHGLPRKPLKVGLRPSALGLWGETQPPDATNIYITVGTAGAVTGSLDVEY